MAQTSLSVRISTAWWVPAAICGLNLWRACGLPVGERLVWALFSAGIKLKAVEG